MKYANKTDDLQFDVINRKLAIALGKQGKPQQAYEYNIKSIKIIEQKIASNEIDKKRFEGRMADACLDASWYALILKKYAEAVALSNKGLKTAPTNLLLETNLAHGLLLSNRKIEAVKIYTRNIGKKMNDKQSWQDVVHEDFTALRKAGITSPEMKKVEKLLKTKQ